MYDTSVAMVWWLELLKTNIRQMDQLIVPNFYLTDT